MKTVAILLLCSALPAVAAEPFTGTWVFDKSSGIYNRLTITFEQSADGLKMSSPSGEHYDAKFDGKDYPASGFPAGDRVLLKRIGGNGVEETLKRKGKIWFSTRMTVSPDGKALTGVLHEHGGRVKTLTATKLSAEKPATLTYTPLPAATSTNWTCFCGCCTTPVGADGICYTNVAYQGQILTSQAQCGQGYAKDVTYCNQQCSLAFPHQCSLEREQATCTDGGPVLLVPAPTNKAEAGVKTKP